MYATVVMPSQRIKGTFMETHKIMYKRIFILTIPLFGAVDVLIHVYPDMHIQKVKNT